MEQWKDIKGYEGLYEISDKGRVKRGYWAKLFKSLHVSQPTICDIINNRTWKHIEV
jgi:hypothetical protein